MLADFYNLHWVCDLEWRNAIPASGRGRKVTSSMKLGFKDYESGKSVDSRILDGRKDIRGNEPKKIHRYILSSKDTNSS